jgi:hypothetical protein
VGGLSDFGALLEVRLVGRPGRRCRAERVLLDPALLCAEDLLGKACAVTSVRTAVSVMLAASSQRLMTLSLRSELSRLCAKWGDISVVVCGQPGAELWNREQRKHQSSLGSLAKRSLTR